MGTVRYDLPFPDALAALIPRIEFAGVQLHLSNEPLKGLCLIVVLKDVQDTYDAAAPPMDISHYFPVPPATHDETNWARWVLEQILLAQRHEAMELFKVDGRRPFAPGHGGGADPYYPIAIY